MNTDPGIADLLRQLRDDTTGLVREELQLAKTEAGEKARRVGRSIAYLAIAGLIGSSALLLMLVGVSHWLVDAFTDRGMDLGPASLLAFITVALVASVTAALLATRGLSALFAESALPNKTARSLREDKQWAQNKIS